MDKSNKCRICLLHGKKLVNLFESIPDPDSLLTYCDKLIACIPSLSVLQTDPYPHSICTMCCGKLDRAYEFYRLCIASDLKLRPHRLKVFVKIETESKREIPEVKEQIIDTVPIPLIETDQPVRKFRKTAARYDGKKYIRRKREPKFKCTICGKLMLGKFALEQHNRIHTGERPFVCEVCGKSFITRGGVKNHLELHNKNRIKKYKCATCPYETALTNQYKRHIIIHTDERPYECNVCGNKFNNPSTLLNHKKHLHSTNSFKCFYCDETFHTIGGQRRHIVRHSDIYYECKECKNPYAKHKGLIDHMRRCHPGIKCPSKKISCICYNTNKSTSS